MSTKQIWSAEITIFVDDIEADTVEEADKKIIKLINKLEAVNTKLDLQALDWTLEPTIVFDENYSGDLPKDEV